MALLRALRRALPPLTSPGAALLRRAPHLPPLRLLDPIVLRPFSAAAAAAASQALAMGSSLFSGLMDTRFPKRRPGFVSRRKRASLRPKGVEAKLGKDAKIIVTCSTGGTMKPTQNLPDGKQPRSLIAAYLLVLNGYKNVFHLEGGLYTWFKEGLPAVEAEE